MAKQQKQKKKVNKEARQRRGIFGSFLHWFDSHTDFHGDKPQAIFVPRKKPPAFGLSVAVTTFKLMLITILVLGFIMAGAVFGVARAFISTAPDLDVTEISDVSLSSYIYDSEGELITMYSGVQNRMWASIDEIPDNLKNAVIATEDARFYSHGGVDIKRIVGSFISNLTSSNIQGGSTITQQLIKNRMLTSERSYKRKIQEAYLALQLESKYTKDQILEAYLNDVNMGEGNYGVKSAARDYFGKSLDELTLRECAMLAGIVNAPNTYNPRRNYYVKNRPEVTNERTDLVLSRMQREGYITVDEYNAAKAEEVHIQETRTNTATGIAPDFISYVIDDVVQAFIKQRGLENTRENRNAIENELRTGGYSIYTTLDQEMQSAVEDAVYNYDRYPKTAKSSDSVKRETNPDGSVTEIEQPQAAATIVDYHTGEVKAMVGGRKPPAGLKMLNRATSRLPVGSSIKPITVYGPALDAGMGAGTIIQNLKGAVNGWAASSSEKSYPTQGSVNGPVTMRTAIQKSLNLSAARVLMEMTAPTPTEGIENAVSYLAKMGIDTESSETTVQRTGAGIALGSSAYSTVEMASMFGTIANKGVYISPTSFTKVTDSNGNVILDGKALQQTNQVYQPSTAWMLVDMLETAVQSGTGSRAQVSGMTIAGKTGSNESKGLYFAGMSPYYSAAVWIGHDDYKSLANSTFGGAYSAPIFQRFMTTIHQEKGLQDKAIIEDSPESLGLVRATVCQVSGMKATDACTHDAGGLTPVTDWFKAGTEPTESCTYHMSLPICAESGKYATPYCPSTTGSASQVFVPSDSVLRNCDLSGLSWYHLTGASDFNYINNPDQFCPLHTMPGATLAPSATPSTDPSATPSAVIPSLPVFTNTPRPTNTPSTGTGN